MSSQLNPVLVGGPSAVRYATTRSFILVLPLLIVVGLLATAALLATPAVAQKRAQAVNQAWSEGGVAAQEHLSQCLSERGKARGAAAKRKGNFFAHLSLLEDVEFCEDTVSRTAGAGPIVFGTDYTGPSIEDVETATQARKAVFSRTVALNKADFQ